MADATTTTVSVSTRDRSHTPFLQNGMAITWAITALIFLVHLYFNRGYGYFSDERAGQRNIG
ncbi:MAG TPA: hypothetical protein VMU24_04030 [Candidatus Acidoferrales bacterium]|nr:hypothetical protein [Candidatus Acidoferrales bacterium]